MDITQITREFYERDSKSQVSEKKMSKFENLISSNEEKVTFYSKQFYL